MRKAYAILLFFLMLTVKNGQAKEIVIFGNEYNPPKIYAENGVIK
jgi:hypothetical protein